MLISTAMAASDAMNTSTTGSTATMNFIMIMIMAGLFYVLLIMPQQRRFKEHRSMLDSLRKGDKVVTSGGLIGKVDKIKEEEGEVVVDLGNGVKVTALRSTIQTKMDDTK